MKNGCKNYLGLEQLLLRSIFISCDSALYRLGAIIFHVYSSGNNNPIAHVLRTLIDAEKNYCQIPKEPFSIIVGTTINICHPQN